MIVAYEKTSRFYLDAAGSFMAPCPGYARKFASVSDLFATYPEWDTVAFREACELYEVSGGGARSAVPLDWPPTTPLRVTIRAQRAWVLHPADPESLRPDFHRQRMLLDSPN